MNKILRELTMELIVEGIKLKSVEEGSKLIEEYTENLEAFVLDIIGQYSQYPSHYTISDVLAEQRKRLQDA